MQEKVKNKQKEARKKRVKRKSKKPNDAQADANFSAANENSESPNIKQTAEKNIARRIKTAFHAFAFTLDTIKKQSNAVVQVKKRTFAAAA